MYIAGNMIYITLVKSRIDGIVNPVPQTGTVLLHDIPGRCHACRQCIDNCVEQLFNAMVPGGINPAKKKDSFHEK
jgi:hypothetical protein